jgi:spore coat protein U-like protein
MIKKTAFLAVCAALIPAGAAMAGCVTFNGGSINATYDPLHGQAVNDLVEPISLSVTRQNGSPLPTAVAAQFVAQNGQRPNLTLGSASGPVYIVHSNDGSFPIVGQGAAPFQQLQYVGVGFPTSPTNATVTVAGLQLIIPAGQDLAAGVYQESLNIQYRCLSGPNDTVQQHADVTTQSSVVPVTITVPDKISANLAGGQSHGLIDFGDFDHLSHRVAIQVRSTGPYNLLITSQNAGKMLLGDLPKGGSDASNSIAYTLLYDGFPVSLGTPGLYQRTGVFGAYLDLVVTAEPIDEKRAGQYSDTLTVTFTPASI